MSAQDDQNRCMVRRALKITLVLAVATAALVATGSAPAHRAVAPHRPAAVTRDIHFQSPSGNINCRLESAWVDCLVKKDTWPRHSSKPASCDVDWVPSEISIGGQVVRVGACRGDVGPLCAPHAGLRCSVLNYGRSASIGLIRCVSAKNGVTCRRRDGRHVGFRIAREGYTLFR